MNIDTAEDYANRIWTEIIDEILGQDGELDEIDTVMLVSCQQHLLANEKPHSRAEEVLRGLGAERLTQLATLVAEEVLSFVFNNPPLSGLDRELLVDELDDIESLWLTVGRVSK